MAIKTRKIISSIADQNLRGVRITVKNYCEVQEFIGGNTVAISSIDAEGISSDHRIKLFTDRGDRVRLAKVGDVIIKLDNGKFGVIKKDVFLGFAK